jgi:hypothetical protein
MMPLRVVQAFLVLLFVDGLMRLGTRTFYRALRLASRVRFPWSATSCAPSQAAVNEASIWYFHRVECLQRAGALWLMLWMRGIRVELVIGFRPVPFQSHAWLEHQQTVINDRPQYRRVFHVLDRI